MQRAETALLERRVGIDVKKHKADHEPVATPHGVRHQLKARSVSAQPARELTNTTKLCSVGYNGSVRTRSQATKDRSPVPPTGPPGDCSDNLSKICRRREADNLWKSLLAAQTVHAAALAMQISEGCVSRQGRGREVGMGVLGEVLAYADGVKAHQVEDLHDYLQATNSRTRCALRRLGTVRG